jgi:hypothetical protein
MYTGASQSLLTFHSEDRLNISIRIKSDYTTKLSENGLKIRQGGDTGGVWSVAVVVKECTGKQGTDNTLCFNVLYSNGSVLNIYMDVVERQGSRILSFYVPYWVVTSSFLTLEYQHDPNSVDPPSPEGLLNGNDSLSADQEYNIKKEKTFFQSFFINEKNEKIIKNEKSSKISKTSKNEKNKKNQKSYWWSDLGVVKRGQILKSKNHVKGFGDLLKKSKGTHLFYGNSSFSSWGMKFVNIFIYTYIYTHINIRIYTNMLFYMSLKEV